MTKIRDFIDNNKLSFEQGNRNTTIVTLIGYTQYLGFEQEDLETELEKEIEEDSFIQDEIDRIWNFCKSKNYKNFWSTSKAKELYNF